MEVSEASPSQTTQLDVPVTGGDTTTPKKTATVSRRTYDSLQTFIVRIIKTNFDLCVTQESKDILDLLLVKLTKHLVKRASDLVDETNKQTITTDTLRCVSELEYGIGNDSVAYADAALLRYKKIRDESKKTNTQVSNADKAGLQLPPARFKTIMENYKYSKQNTGGDSFIYLTAVVEFILLKILTAARPIVVDDDKKTISDLHLRKAMGSESAAKFVSTLGPLYVVPYGLCVSGDNERSKIQKEVFSKIKTKRRKNNSKKAKAAKAAAKEAAATVVGDGGGSDETV
jgi:hypothetical protein